MINKKILIVDDEPRITESLKYIFESKGFSVQTSSNGLEAVEIFKQTPVKVVLTDIKMPNLNGFNFMQAVKKIDPFVQLIFLTGYADIENIKKAFKKDAFEFFKKPIDNNILLNAVENADSKYDQLKNEHEIKQKNKRTLSTIAKIFNSLEAIVYVCDMETHELIFTNKNFNKVQGYTDDKNLVDQKCWKVIQNDQTGPCPFCTNSRIVDDAGLPTKAYEWEFYNETTNTLYRIIDKAIEWVDGRIVRLETAYDITEKRKNEKLFRQYEKTHESFKSLQSLGTLAGGIAHQFNNSLSVITGHLDLIEIKFSENSELKNHLRKMLNSTEKMTHLTASLLAYARGGKYRSQAFIFSKFIKETIEHIKYKLPPAISLIVDFSENDHHIKADKAQIQMLLSAVIENAIEAMDQIGTIKITCEKEKIDQTDFEKLKSRFKRDYICLTVVDDGRGMDNEIKERIFEPFFTTGFEGRGIGMSAAYGIVKNHQGFISIDSKVGKGTTVKVFLPIKTVHKTTLSKERDHTTKQHLTILLIEDEEAVMEVTKMMLEGMGHKVLEANTGRKAIDLVESYKGPIHLTFLDFLLPDINGDVIYPLLAKSHPEMDVIVLSGYALTEPVQKILDAGAKTFLQKPATMAELSAQIDKL